MKSEYLRIFFILTGILILQSCGGMEKSLERASKPFNNKAAIQYTTNEVIVTYFNYQNAPYRQGATAHLNTSTKNNISSGTFKAERKAGNVISLVAHIPMPRTFPMQRGDTCFHITSPNNKLIPVREKKGQEGFTNPLWQSAIADPTKKVFLTKRNRSIKSNILVLHDKKLAAEKYVNTSSVVKDGLCILPKPSYQKPLQPYSNEFMMASAIMPAAICADVPIGNATEKARLSVIGQDNIALPKTIKLYRHDSATNVAISTYRKTAKEMITRNSTHQNCQARSDCSITEQLYYGSPYRDYIKSYNSCTQRLAVAIDSTVQQHAVELQKWESEPEMRKRYCITQFDFLKTVDVDIARMENDIDKNNQSLTVLETSTTSVDKLTEGDQSTCRVL